MRQLHITRLLITAACAGALAGCAVTSQSPSSPQPPSTSSPPSSSPSGSGGSPSTSPSQGGSGSESPFPPQKSPIGSSGSGSPWQAQPGSSGQPSAQGSVATSSLARARTGDVLAGIIVGLLAQGVESYAASVAGSWIHAQAGLFAMDRIGNPASVMGSDVVDSIGDVLVGLT